MAQSDRATRLWVRYERARELMDYAAAISACRELLAWLQTTAQPQFHPGDGQPVTYQQVCSALRGALYLHRCRN